MKIQTYHVPNAKEASITRFQRTMGPQHADKKMGGNGGSIMVGHRYWMPPPRQFQPMFQVLSTINCYATSSR